MLYFAYGSNLNHAQMRYRCEGSKYKKKFMLKEYKLIFSYRDPKEPYGYANIQKRKGSKVPGAIWNITKRDELELDRYEGVRFGSYDKEYFTLKGKKVLVYIQSKYIKKKPHSRYLHTIVQGYKDCKLDINYLKKRIFYYSINYPVRW